MRLWRRKREPEPMPDLLADVMRQEPRPIPRGLSPRGTVQPPAAEAAEPPLNDRERYRLMFRFNLTSAQVDRLPLDIARTLLGLL
jgi:hypothetical protein